MPISLASSVNCLRNRNKDSEYDYIDETSEEDCSQAHCLGLQRECTKFLEKTKNFVDKNVPTEDAHDIYIKLFNKVHDFDEHIAERYDDLGGSYYYLTVYSLYVEGVLTALIPQHYNLIFFIST